MGKMIVPYILIVENGYMNRPLVSANLLKEGFTVRFANTTELALKLLIKSRPFLIVIDLIMSKLSAATFNSILKNDEDTSSIKVIAFSDKYSDKPFGNFDSLIYTKGKEKILINSLKTYLTTMTPIISSIIFLENNHDNK